MLLPTTPLLEGEPRPILPAYRARMSVARLDCDRPLPAVPALADESTPEYRAPVRPAPVEPAETATPAARSKSRAERQLDTRQDQLLLALGHELKSPITSIKGMVQLATTACRRARIRKKSNGWRSRTARSTA